MKMGKNRVVLDCDADCARMLRSELGKVRCWLTGFSAGRHIPGGSQFGIPGEDSLRQLQILLDHAEPVTGTVSV